MPLNDEGEVLYGVPAIATYLGMRERQARHRIDEGELPSFKIGATICARRSTLRAWLAELEAAALAARQPAPISDADANDIAEQRERGA